MAEYEAVCSAAAGLSVADRLRLIDELAASVPEDQPPTLSEPWLAEIERRSAEIDAGVVTPEPWSEVRQRLFRKVPPSESSWPSQPWRPCRHGSRKVFGKGSGGKPFFRKVSPSTSDKPRLEPRFLITPSNDRGRGTL